MLTEIDVQATLRDKLGEEMEDASSLVPATRGWRTGRSALTAGSDCYCPATW